MKEDEYLYNSPKYITFKYILRFPSFLMHNWTHKVILTKINFEFFVSIIAASIHYVVFNATMVHESVERLVYNYLEIVSLNLFSAEFQWLNMAKIIIQKKLYPCIPWLIPGLTLYMYYHPYFIFHPMSHKFTFNPFAAKRNKNTEHVPASW